MTAPLDTPWHCPTCGTVGTTPFCAQCGEQRLAPGDLSLRHFGGAIAESLFSWDGRILGTLASFVRRPGELTVAYLEGRRKPFLNPLQLFLLINVLFFFQQGFTDWTTYSTPWNVHVRDAAYADLAKSVARWRLDLLGIPHAGPEFQAYVQRFNAAVGLIAKSLVILMVPFVALLVALVQLGRPRQAAVHLTVGLHLTAYLLAIQTVFLPLCTMLQLTLHRWGRALDNGTLDFVLTWTINLLIAALCVPLYERVFGRARGWAIVQAAVTGVMIFDGVQLYRGVLFIVTLFTTS